MKNFDKWNKVKKEIDEKVVPDSVFFHERDIWWCMLGVNIGIEANGKNELFERPVLLIKVFNKDMIWCLPITSTLKDSPFYHRIFFNEEERSIMTTQIRTISSKRLLRKVETLGEGDFNEILYSLISFLKSESSLSGAISEAEATNDSIINEYDNISQENGEYEVD
ncbi:MAG: type II toxin-antitoxin system PemK/MazF family toxin [Candidatus Taylorbacteria bacterium]|nr:type II toxin-antitoxin system PemK/MazF family toxin [Candidatus Taylorbacteria bacterium]